MLDCDQYRMHADECERMARRSALAADRNAFLELAAEWRRLEQEVGRVVDPRERE